MEHYLGASLVDAKKTMEEIEAVNQRWNQEALDYIEAVDRLSNSDQQNVQTKRIPGFSYTDSTKPNP